MPFSKNIYILLIIFRVLQFPPFSVQFISCCADTELNISAILHCSVLRCVVGPARPPVRHQWLQPLLRIESVKGCFLMQKRFVVSPHRQFIRKPAFLNTETWDSTSQLSVGMPYSCLTFYTLEVWVSWMSWLSQWFQCCLWAPVTQYFVPIYSFWFY